MTECQSTRGEWGEICPDCGQRLPARQPPLAAWKSSRSKINLASQETGRKTAQLEGSKFRLHRRKA